MPKLAITVFYMEGQNAPSKPDSDLITLPDDEVKRDQMLIERYRSETSAHHWIENVTVTPTQEYGDLQVSSDNSDIHMFVTFAIPSDDE